MFAKLRLASTLSEFHLMSLPGVFPVITVILRASAPYLAIISSGSTPAPFERLILLPSAFLTSPCSRTWENGFSPMNLRPENIILATQKNMMSYPVSSTVPGYQCSSSGVVSGHPIIENGHRADENQVSSTSSSCLTGPLHFGHSLNSTLEAVSLPQASQYHTGILWPHHSCLDMHQSLQFSIQLR